MHYKKILFFLFIFSIFWSISLFGKYDFSQFAYAQEKSSGIKTYVQVGEFSLFISGIFSPNGSVALQMPTGEVLNSSKAQENGAFNHKPVLVNRGLESICFKATDAKSTGDSTSCASFSPVSANMDLADVFLPPSLGIERAELSVGSTLIVEGYTMPGSVVQFFLSPSQVFSSNAQSNGYYSFDIENMSIGEYSVYAVATYQGKESLKPTVYKKVTVTELEIAGVRQSSWYVILLGILILIIVVGAIRYRKKIKQVLGI